MAKTVPAPEIAYTRAVHLENDTAALYLIRRATQIEQAALRASDDGNIAGASNKLVRARVLRTVARRLVLAARPEGLGVPGWLGVVARVEAACPDNGAAQW